MSIVTHAREKRCDERTCTCPRFDTPQGSIILHTSLTCPMHGPIKPREAEWRGPEHGWAFSRSER